MTAIRDRNDFVRRTIEILELEFTPFEERDREVTFLLNCLLGTIVSVSEYENKAKKKLLTSRIDNDFLASIPDKIGFLRKVKNGDDLISADIDSINFKVGHKTDLKEKTKIWLLKKIRNGIAHLNIEWENDNGKCKAIRLWNEPRSEVKDFEVVFTIEELKEFAITLSKKYLKAI